MYFCEIFMVMESVLSRSHVVTEAVLKACWALIKVLVAFPFVGNFLLLIAGVDVFGKLLKIGRIERRSLILSLLKLIGRGYESNNCGNIKTKGSAAVVLRTRHDQRRSLTWFLRVPESRN